MKELQTYREIITLNDQMKVNLEMYPQALREGKIRAVREPIDDQLNSGNVPSDFNGIQGSFRKLEID